MQGLRDGRDRHAGVRTRSPGRRAGGAAARVDGQGPRPAGPRPSGRGRRGRGAPRRGRTSAASTWPTWPAGTRSARPARSSPRGASTPSSICCPTRGRCGTARACGSITARRSCSARIAVASARDGDGTAAEIAPGRSAYARIRFEAPAVLTRGDRFIVRAYSPPVTIGGGVVLDPAPAALGRFGMPRRWRASAVSTRRRRWTARSWRSWTSGAAPGSARGALVSRAGLSASGADATRHAGWSRLGRATRVGDLLVSPAVLQDLSSTPAGRVDRAPRITAAVGRAVARRGARASLRPCRAGRLRARGGGAGGRGPDRRPRSAGASPGHHVSLSPEEARAHEAHRAAVPRGWAGPAGRDGAARGGQRQRGGRRPDHEAARPPEDARQAGHAAVSRRGAGGSEGRRAGAEGQARASTSPAFKERYGISRKYAIPLLEYLDRERVTRRVGDARVVL